MERPVPQSSDSSISGRIQVDFSNRPTWANIRKEFIRRLGELIESRWGQEDPA